MDASLLVLAAGMGSRYGGLKQLDAFGPHGETIIDYSVYDAIRAGFNKVVFVIRQSFRDEFESYFRKRMGDHIQMEFVEQELDDIPDGFEIHPDRAKPWGTAHAVMMGQKVIHEPFAVINADDYYGPESYSELIDFFSNHDDSREYAVVAYLLKNTLSDHGAVNRGICYQDNKGYLSRIVETLSISKSKDSISYPHGDSTEYLDEDTLVSMNMFGFLPSYFQLADKYFREFLREKGTELKSEFFIPLSLDKMINNKEIKMKVLTSSARWFGVTYREDKPHVMKKIRDLINAGVYPEKLWD